MIVNELQDFKDALLATKVAGRFAAEAPVAMEFTSPEAMKKYLEDHPGADPANHSVKKDEGGGEAPAGGAAPKKDHVLDGDIPGLQGHDIAKLKSGKASKDEYKKAMDGLDAAADKLYEKDERSEEDEAALAKMEKAKSHLSDKWHTKVQQSPEYKTTRTEDYYPQKKPAGYKDAEGAAKIKAKLPPEDQEWANKMPDADLDKEEAYDHPRIKAVSKALQKKVKSGEISLDQLGKRMENLENLRTELHKGHFGDNRPKSDEEEDGWRFPARQLYKLWQGYNDAFHGIQSGR